MRDSNSEQFFPHPESTRSRGSLRTVFDLDVQPGAFFLRTCKIIHRFAFCGRKNPSLAVAAAVSDINPLIGGYVGILGIAV
jgi:hypothetical protein